MNIPRIMEMEVKNGMAYMTLFGCPGPMKVKALKENGFTLKKGVYVAKITESNCFFIQLLTGQKIRLEE